ncbi:MAG: hypothetical protein EOO74_08790 [Myxococcales bacterium]|nr:MAG: hypothetical protein EOO74_08790 [Myxococcales bacterium]
MTALPIEEVLTEMERLGHLKADIENDHTEGTCTVRLRASGDRELAVEGTDLTNLVSILLSSEIGRAGEEHRPKDALALQVLRTRVLRQGVSP